MFVYNLSADIVDNHIMRHFYGISAEIIMNSLLMMIMKKLSFIIPLNG